MHARGTSIQISADLLQHDMDVRKWTRTQTLYSAIAIVGIKPRHVQLKSNRFTKVDYVFILSTGNDWEKLIESETHESLMFLRIHSSRNVLTSTRRPLLHSKNPLLRSWSSIMKESVGLKTTLAKSCPSLESQSPTINCPPIFSSTFISPKERGPHPTESRMIHWNEHLKKTQILAMAHTAWRHLFPSRRLSIYVPGCVAAHSPTTFRSDMTILISRSSQEAGICTRFFRLSEWTPRIEISTFRIYENE